MSVLNRLVSYFPNKNSTTHGISINLLTILLNNRHKDTINKLRESEPDAQKQIKNSLPCYTPSGTFSRRCDDGIHQGSGIAAVDLDSAEDYDLRYLLKELQKIPSIAYAGLSCRGKRLFCLVPFLYPDQYERHYDRLIQSFKDYGLPMGDECHKSISQPRFISWNDNGTQFFNHDAVPYSLLEPEKTIFQAKQSKQVSAKAIIRENEFAWCNEQVNKSFAFVKGQRHSYIIHLSRYCNLKGIPIQDTLIGCLSYAETDFEVNEITKIVNHIYKSQAESHRLYA